eukprot:m.171620 g.171620  ORF g.171620 m.171620 type:complete len:349 (+) comp16706_c0_seq1:29-1075(+)
MAEQPKGGRRQEGNEPVSKVAKCEGTPLTRCQKHYQQRNSTTISISASQVAAICGLNPHASLVELFTNHVYQRLQGLLELDAANLGLELVTEEQQLFSTLDQSPTLLAMVAELEAIPPPTSSLEAQRQHVTIAQRLDQEQTAGHLTVEQARTVTSYLSHTINTTFGHSQESAALDAYTAKTGYDVTDRNNQLYRHQVAAQDGCPCFIVCGMVDGLAQIPCFPDPDSDDMELLTAVVEVKTRVHRIQEPPPFYEQVQAVVYLKLTGLARVELVQYLNTTSEPSARDIAVSTIELNGPHATAWTDVILPRLRMFVTVVQRYREDDGLRMQWLQSSDAEQKLLLHQLLPYI